MYLKFRLTEADGTMTKDGLAEALKGRVLYYKRNPSPQDCADITKGFSSTIIGEGTAAPDDLAGLRRGHLLVKNTETDSLRHGDFLAFYLPADAKAPTIDAKYFVVRQVDKTRFLPPMFDLPELTFTNVTAGIKNEDFVFAHLIPFVTLAFDWPRLHLGGTEASIALSWFFSADIVGLLNIRGQVFPAGDRSYWETILPRSIFFGMLLDLEIGSRRYYVGAGFNVREGWGCVNPRKPGDSLYDRDERVPGELLDVGIVIGAAVFDWLELIRNLSEKSGTTIN